MPEQISLETASELFSTTFQSVYQSVRALSGTIMERHGTTGTALNVPVIGKTELQETGFAPTNIPISTVEKTNVVCVQKEYTNKLTIGRGEKTLFNYDEIKAYADAQAKAVARWEDYLKIQAIYNDPNFSNIQVVPVNKGVNTGVNQGKLTEGLKFLERAGVDTRRQQCSLWLPATLKDGFFADDRVVNLFYNDERPLVDNDFPSYLGVSMRTLGDASAGINSLPYTTAGSTNTYQVPLVHHDSMIISFNIDPEADIVWVPQEKRWELVVLAVAGAKVVQTAGIALLTANDPYAAN